jgi:hypothetical protein
MALSIYKKIDIDSCGGNGVVMEAYATFLRATLTDLWPEAAITIETTTRESGVMPLVIDGATGEEAQEMRDAIHAAWERFCGTR